MALKQHVVLYMDLNSGNKDKDLLCKQNHEKQPPMQNTLALVSILTSVWIAMRYYKA